jgi:hypothetical protein
VIATLKVIAILATALFGVFGSFANFRDTRGRITRLGWVGLSGIIVSGGLAAGLQLYTDAEQERSVLEIVQEIDKSLHPLSGLHVKALLRPDWQKDEFRSYLRKFEASQPAKTAFGNTPFPQIDEAPLLHYSVCQVDLVLLFYRKPIDLSAFAYKLEGSGEDLRIDVHNECATADFLRRLGAKTPQINWEFDIRDGKLRRLDLELPEATIQGTAYAWVGNGKISSLQDLLGAELVIQLVSPSIVDRPPEFARAKVEDYRKSVRSCPGKWCRK